MPIWGHAADRFGRKPMLLWASLGMAIIVFSMGFAPNVLIALRLAQGAIAGSPLGPMIGGHIGDKLGLWKSVPEKNLTITSAPLLRVFARIFSASLTGPRSSIWWPKESLMVLR